MSKPRVSQPQALRSAQLGWPRLPDEQRLPHPMTLPLKDVTGPCPRMTPTPGKLPQVPAPRAQGPT